MSSYELPASELACSGKIPNTPTFFAEASSSFPVRCVWYNIVQQYQSTRYQVYHRHTTKKKKKGVVHTAYCMFLCTINYKQKELVTRRWSPRMTLPAAVPLRTGNDFPATTTKNNRTIRWKIFKTSITTRRGIRFILPSSCLFGSRLAFVFPLLCSCAEKSCSGYRPLPPV